MVRRDSRAARQQARREGSIPSTAATLQMNRAANAGGGYCCSRCSTCQAWGTPNHRVAPEADRSLGPPPFSGDQGEQEPAMDELRRVPRCGQHETAPRCGDCPWASR